MKRLIGLCLIICMGISFCACGEKKEEYFTVSDFIEEEVEEVFYKIGDTVSTDRAEFKLNSAEFAEAVWIDTYEVATPAGTKGESMERNIERNYIEMCVVFEIENIGETIIDDWMYNEEGVYETKNIKGYVELVYDEDACRARDMIDRTTNTEDLYLLVGARHKYSGFYGLSRDAYTDTDTTLYLQVKLPNSKGEFETFKYQLR